MEFELFLVSVIYWAFLLMVFVWLGTRLASLKDKVTDLEKGGSKDQN